MNDPYDVNQTNNRFKYPLMGMEMPSDLEKER
jgi:hypothetical protein